MKAYACSLVLFSLSLLAQSTPSQPILPNRAVPDNNLAYPVFITIGSGTGSGFFLNTEAATYLVTAKHVLFDERTGLLIDNTIRLTSYSKDLLDTTANEFTIDVAKLGAANIKLHPTKDVVVLKISTADPARKNVSSTLPGVTIVAAAKMGIVGVGSDVIRKFDTVLVGNSVMIMGYPTSLSLQEMPEIDPRRPLLRKGIVAGVNRKTGSIILDCPAYFGNSGGPVLEIDQVGLRYHVSVIGVISKYVPYRDGGKTFAILANSGYSIAVPIDFVLELVK